MREPAVTRRLWHVALEGTGGGRPLAELAAGEGGAVDLTDFERMAIVFQGAALLAHLEHVGWRLGDGTVDTAWRDAELVDGFLLRTQDVRPGVAVDPPHRLVLELLELVFHARDGEVAGRGAARKAARGLTRHWRQELYRIPPDVVLAQVLDYAPFLWKAKLAAARTALAAEHLPAGDSALWVAGPGRARRRFLDAADDRTSLLALLTSADARDRWDGFAPDLDPWRLYRAGRFRRAAVIWRRRRRLRGSEALAFARALLAAGRGFEALEAVKRRRDVDALVTRFLVQMELGERAAANKTLGALDGAELSDRQLVRLGEMAIRLHAARGGRRAKVRTWVSRVLAVDEPEARLGALIVAASAAWDLGEPAAMAGYLEQARPALGDPNLAWRWHHAEGLRYYTAGAGPDARHHVERALLLGRRRLGRSEAARLWNDVGVMRLLSDDIVGAEKACHQMVRLMIGCDGSTTDTLALHNLASLRIRRGRLEGVEEQLERSLAENRRAGNARAVICDLELQTRFELARGRPEAALQRRAEVGDGADPSIARAPTFAALAGRARGWLGHRRRAAAGLEAAGEEGLGELDPEERAAAWALAGDFDEALRQAEGTPWAPLWAALAADLPVDDRHWTPLDTLEPYRAARFIYDIELLRPGSAPPAWTRRAAERLRSLGATAMAEALDRGALEPWRALRRYAAAPPGPGRVRELFRRAGYPDTRLTLSAGASGGDPHVVLDGPGGPARLEQPRAGRLLVLEAPFVDEVQRSLLALVADELLPEDGDGDGATRRGAEARPGAHHGDGILGESRALCDALARLDRLADGDLPMLVLGESGTGKELAARRAHRLSRRAEGPFMAVNCAAFSESLIRSELFGHVRGAFTGADRDRRGLFESARSGTVFLDEIGDLPLAVQGHLLRVLQEGEIRRVGESMARTVDVRVVAATHQGLADMVERGTFRRDLYFRLKVATVELPPLRERGRDVLVIARSVLTKARGGALSKDAESALLDHRWPGNIRELVNTLEVAAVLSRGDTLERHHLDLPEPRGAARGAGDYKHDVERYKKRLVASALERTGGNRSQAARHLGMTRQALSYLADKFGL